MRGWGGARAVWIVVPQTPNIVLPRRFGQTHMSPPCPRIHAGSFDRIKGGTERHPLCGRGSPLATDRASYPPSPRRMMVLESAIACPAGPGRVNKRDTRSSPGVQVLLSNAGAATSAKPPADLGEPRVHHCVTHTRATCTIRPSPLLRNVFFPPLRLWLGAPCAQRGGATWGGAGQRRSEPRPETARPRLPQRGAPCSPRRCETGSGRPPRCSRFAGCLPRGSARFSRALTRT